MDAISANDLRTLLERETTVALLDVREGGEYEAGHIPGATWFPRRDIEIRLRDLVPLITVPLVVYGAHDGREILAAKTMAAMGYTVSVLEDGVAAWAASGHPLRTGVNVPSKAFGERLLVEEHLPEITAGELAAGMARGARLVIIDVRTPEEYRRSTIPSATNVPGGDLVLLADDLARNGDATVVVHCAGRTRSLMAAASLCRLGLTNVRALRNGTMGWMLDGRELERRPARPALTWSATSRERGERLADEIAARDGVPLIAATEVQRLLGARDRQLVYAFDVRSETEYETGHVQGFLSRPGAQAVQRADDFVPARSAVVVFACDRRARAIMAASWFRRMGFRNACVLDGGTTAWVASGRPLLTGSTPPICPELDRARRAVRGIAAGDLAALLERRSPLVLDVATSLQHEARHVPGARWISRGWLELKIPEAVKDRQQAIVVTCATGEQSTLAAATLGALGFSDVSVLQGGTRAWVDAGRPTEKGVAAPLVEPNDVPLRGLMKGERDAMLAYLCWEVELAGKGHAG